MYKPTIWSSLYISNRGFSVFTPILPWIWLKKNQQCLDRYETVVGEKYKEPVDGKFEDATDSILQRLKEPEDSGDDADSNSDLDS